MKKLSGLSPERVFYYFEELSAIPRGSGNRAGISNYCVNFARENGLRVVQDADYNVVIYKDATAGYEQAETVILQGHLDMVCQKSADCTIDFDRDGLDLYTDGDFLKARGTTLGADNGIAVAMIFAILENKSLQHPALEAVLTVDEEIGLLGAHKLDVSLLSGKKMINLDSEEQDVITVSCAGGSDICIEIPYKKVEKQGTKLTVSLSGLKGGHSGVEIGSGRVNAAILSGRVLSHLAGTYRLLNVTSGDKINAIPRHCSFTVVTEEADSFIRKAENYLALIKSEISTREPDFSYTVTKEENGSFSVLDEVAQDKVTKALLCAPNGVLEMSADISGLVETSLNLGILKTLENAVSLNFSLRSNKQSALDFLEEKMLGFAALFGANTKTSGHYPPWEFKENSVLRNLYRDVYLEELGENVKVEAIHAGLECGVFASQMPELDCIAIGPQMYDVHTDGERLSISSTETVFRLLCKLLERCR